MTDATTPGDEGEQDDALQARVVAARAAGGDLADHDRRHAGRGQRAEDGDGRHQVGVLAIALGPEQTAEEDQGDEGQAERRQSQDQGCAQAAREIAGRGDGAGRAPPGVENQLVRRGRQGLLRLRMR